MPTYLSVPKLGMALANATVVEWKVVEGERVEKGQAIVTIETQKTKFDIEAEVPGLVHILVAPDTEVAVGRVVGMLTARCRGTRFPSEGAAKRDQHTADRT